MGSPRTCVCDPTWLKLWTEVLLEVADLCKRPTVAWRANSGRTCIRSFGSGAGRWVTPGCALLAPSWGQGEESAAQPDRPPGSALGTEPGLAMPTRLCPPRPSGSQPPPSPSFPCGHTGHSPSFLPPFLSALGLDQGAQGQAGGFWSQRRLNSGGGTEPHRLLPFAREGWGLPRGPCLSSRRAGTC